MWGAEQGACGLPERRSNGEDQYGQSDQSATPCGLGACTTQTVYTTWEACKTVQVPHYAWLAQSSII